VGLEYRGVEGIGRGDDGLLLVDGFAEFAVLALLGVLEVALAGGGAPARFIGGFEGHDAPIGKAEACEVKGGAAAPGCRGRCRAWRCWRIPTTRGG